MSEVSSSFHLADGLPQLEINYNPATSIHPDRASVSMAGIAMGMVRRAKLAQELCDGQYPGTVRVVDLGTGNGVIGATCAVAPEVTSMTLVDNDPEVLPYAVRNVQASEPIRRQGIDIVRQRSPWQLKPQTVGHITCNAVEGDWRDPSFWQALGPADLIICNPPFMVEGETIRPGYEQSPREHLFVADTETLVASYAAIITNAVANMRTWDIVAVRLPKGDTVDTEGQWVNMAADQVQAAIKRRTDSAYYLLYTHRFNTLSDHPLHALTIERLPLDYPTISPTSDVRVIHLLTTGEQLPQGIASLVRHPPRTPNEMRLINEVI